MRDFRKTFHKICEHADDLPVSSCIADFLNKQIIVIILMFYSILHFLVSSEQGIMIKNKRTKIKI